MVNSDELYILVKKKTIKLNQYDVVDVVVCLWTAIFPCAISPRCIAWYFNKASYPYANIAANPNNYNSKIYVSTILKLSYISRASSIIYV